MFDIGLVVGKFCPLHRGHEHVIYTAFAQSNRVVIISYTSKDYYPAAQRRLWLTSLYPTATVIVPEIGFPDDDAPEYDHREYCRVLLGMLNLLPDAVFGSEAYIDGFAKHLGAYPVVVDIDRLTHTVSGTDLREKRVPMDEWVDPIVTRPVAKRILLIGGESSGKTTLSKALVKARPLWGLVEEFGRYYGETHNQEYDFSSMLYIAKQQIIVEENAMFYYQNSFIVCDTSPLVTKFYSQKWYGCVHPELELLSQRTYDYVFMCHRDFDYAYEDGRSGPSFSDEQAGYYMRHLGQNVIHLFGSVEDRVKAIFKEIK